MKFQLAINLERMDDSQDMGEVARHTLEMVQMAEEGGFEIVWSAEHHALTAETGETHPHLPVSMAEVVVSSPLGFLRIGGSGWRMAAQLCTLRLGAIDTVSRKIIESDPGAPGAVSVLLTGKSWGELANDIAASSAPMPS